MSELSIDGIEILWAQVNIRTKVVIFGVCYRPPNQISTETDFSMDALYATFETHRVRRRNVTRGRNVLDLLITNNRDPILDFKVCDPIDNLDHCPVYGTLNVHTEKPKGYKRIVRQ